MYELWKTQWDRACRGVCLPDIIPRPPPFKPYLSIPDVSKERTEVFLTFSSLLWCKIRFISWSFLALVALIAAFLRLYRIVHNGLLG